MSTTNYVTDNLTESTSTAGKSAYIEIRILKDEPRNRPYWLAKTIVWLDGLFQNRSEPPMTYVLRRVDEYTITQGQQVEKIYNTIGVASALKLGECNFELKAKMK